MHMYIFMYIKYIFWKDKQEINNFGSIQVMGTDMRKRRFTEYHFELFWILKHWTVLPTGKLDSKETSVLIFLHIKQNKQKNDFWFGARFQPQLLGFVRTQLKMGIKCIQWFRGQGVKTGKTLLELKVHPHRRVGEKANLMNMCFKLSMLPLLKCFGIVFDAQIKCHHINNSF